MGVRQLAFRVVELTADERVMLTKLAREQRRDTDAMAAALIRQGLRKKGPGARGQGPGEERSALEPGTWNLEPQQEGPGAGEEGGGAGERGSRGEASSPGTWNLEPADGTRPDRSSETCQVYPELDALCERLRRSHAQR